MPKNEKPRLTRYKMYNDILSSINTPIKGKILAVTDISGFKEIIDFDNSEIIEISYPDVDCQNLPYDDNSFDAVISDQVLEHVVAPSKAINEALRVLKPNGIAIHTTCFVNYYHEAPIDYWRFSPPALLYLHQGFSEVITCRGWGNRLAIMLCMLGDRFRAMPIPDSKFSLRRIIASYNEEKYPISTWIVAKK